MITEPLRFTQEQKEVIKQTYEALEKKLLAYDGSLEIEISITPHGNLDNYYFKVIAHNMADYLGMNGPVDGQQDKTQFVHIGIFPPSESSYYVTFRFDFGSTEMRTEFADIITQSGVVKVSDKGPVLYSTTSEDLTDIDFEKPIMLYYKLAENYPG